MEIRQHLRFAARQLRRNPGFTVTVMPYSHPERMGTI